MSHRTELCRLQLGRREWRAQRRVAPCALVAPIRFLYPFPPHTQQIHTRAPTTRAGTFCQPELPSSPHQQEHRVGCNITHDPAADNAYASVSDCADVQRKGELRNKIKACADTKERPRHVAGGVEGRPRVELLSLKFTIA